MSYTPIFSFCCCFKTVVSIGSKTSAATVSPNSCEGANLQEVENPKMNRKMGKKSNSFFI